MTGNSLRKIHEIRAKSGGASALQRSCSIPLKNHITVTALIYIIVRQNHKPTFSDLRQTINAV